jgi:phage portal protein BeeE
MGVRQWISQVERDANVCGNGYLVTAMGSVPRIYALRPETVEILDDNRYATLSDGSMSPVEGHVIHIRGVEQFDSLYGISILEPVLDAYSEARQLSAAKEAANRILKAAGESSPEAASARSLLELAARRESSSDQRLEKLLYFPRDWPADTGEGLYFPGQARM